MRAVRERTVRSLVYFAAGLGLIVAIFAAAEFYDASLRAVCSVSAFFSCSAVDSSGYTNTLGLPDWLWGVGGFVLILLFAGLAEQRPEDRRRAWLLLAVTTLGVGVSLYLLYVELAIIHALCLVCASDYLLGGVAWLGALALVLRPRETAGDGERESEGNDARTA